MKKFIIVCLLALTFLIGLEIGLTFIDPIHADTKEIRVDTVCMYDTVIVREPVVRDSIIVRWMTRYIDKNEDKEETQPPDTIPLTVPIYQKIYSDEGYKAWVSGCYPRLDSIHLYRQTEIVEREVVVKEKQRRWGCVAGAGVSVGNNYIGPTVGITIGYRLF